MSNSTQNDLSKAMGNCYHSCAYCCYRQKLGTHMNIRVENGQVRVSQKIKNDKIPTGESPQNGYFMYCPKNPKTGFDIIEEINDDFNLISGLFHVQHIVSYPGEPICPCFESKFSRSNFAQEQHRVNEYFRLSFMPRMQHTPKFFGCF